MGTSRLIISDEERREVAAKLRETEPFEHGGEKWYDEGKILDALDLSFDNVPSIYDPEKVKHLADLIDRPTTTLTEDEDGRFCCANCGCAALYMSDAAYCPDCGAVVVSDDD